MKTELNFIFSSGFRCCSVNFLEKYELRKIASPFDAMYIDLETCFELVQNRLRNFLTDIAVIDFRNKTQDLLYSTYTAEVNPKLRILMEDYHWYMGNIYDYHIINQNFLDNVVSNMYDWTRICVFHHNHITDTAVYDTIKNRCNRMNYITANYEASRIALFCISRIISCTDIDQYIQEIIEQKRRHNIQNWLIYIICSDTISRCHRYVEHEQCLFIIKQVDNYEYQKARFNIENDVVSNNYNYDDEYNTMLQYFDFKLIDKSTVDVNRQSV